MADGIDTFIDAIGRVTAWSSFALAAVMGGNVLLRYAFHTGTVWSQELEWHLMAPICLFGMSYALRHGEHVRVDVLFASFSPRTKDMVELVSSLLLMAISLIVIWLSISYVMQSWSVGEGIGQSGRYSSSLHPQESHPDRLRAHVPAGVRRCHPLLSRLAESPLMPLNEILAILMLVAFFVLLLAGIPVAVTLATAGLVFGYIGFGPLLFHLLPNRIYGVVTNYTLIAMPLFVFMGVMLEKSRLAEDLMEVIAHAAGNLRGGLGIGIILVGVLMGATTGIVGATVVTLGLLTLPTLLRRKYDKGLACGIICASGTLGQIIPPSLILILLADILNELVGTLFAAAMIPGLMLAGIYVVYLLGLGFFRPQMVPAVPQDERDLISATELAGKLLRVVLPPIALVGAVLGSIIAGVAAPTEAASMGALGAIVVTAIGGRMSWAVLRDTTYATTRITAMMMFILMCAQAFSLAFRGLQGEKLVQDFFAFLPGGTSGAIWFLMFIIFILGFFIEWIEISYIAVPIFLPIFIAANVDMVWLATLICVNLQTSFLTPPFGWALFFLRGVAPPEVTTGDIYRGIVPFVAMQIIALVLCFFFPALALWLPKTIGW